MNKKKHKKAALGKKLNKTMRRKELLRIIHQKMQSEAQNSLSLNDVILALCERHEKSFLLSDAQNKALQEVSDLTKRTAEDLINSMIEMGIKS